MFSRQSYNFDCIIIFVLFTILTLFRPLYNFDYGITYYLLYLTVFLRIYFINITVLFRPV